MTGMFELNIEMGNDAMMTPRNVAHALRFVAEHLEKNNFAGIGVNQGNIRDRNGNEVGKWLFRTSYPDLKGLENL